MTDRELMQQALEALELLARYENPATKIQVRKPKNGGSIVTMYPHKVATEAAAPLRERLAQPEPVIDKSAAIRIATALGWVPPSDTSQERVDEAEKQRQEQEPVAWYCKEGLNRGVSLKQESPEWEPLYTISQHRRPLSDDEADEFVRRFARYELIRAIEAAHGIKGEA